MACCVRCSHWTALIEVSPSAMTDIDTSRAWHFAHPCVLCAANDHSGAGSFFAHSPSLVMGFLLRCEVWSK